MTLSPFRVALRRRQAGARDLAGTGSGLKVGIAWAGNPKHAGDRRRSIPLEQLAPILDVPGVRFYSLQVGAPAIVKRAPLSESATLDQPSAVLVLPDKPSIAVLPFQNMSGDQEQEYFADGVVEDAVVTA